MCLMKLGMKHSLCLISIVSNAQPSESMPMRKSCCLPKRSSGLSDMNGVSGALSGNNQFTSPRHRFQFEPCVVGIQEFGAEANEGGRILDSSEWQQGTQNERPRSPPFQSVQAEVEANEATWDAPPDMRVLACRLLFGNDGEPFVA